MAQAVSRRSFTVEAWVRSQASPCEICGRHSGTGTGFFRVFSFPPVSIILTMHRAHIHLSPTLYNLSN